MRGSGDTLHAGLDVNGKSARINPVCSPTQHFSSHPAVCTHSRIIIFLKLTMIRFSKVVLQRRRGAPGSSQVAAEQQRVNFLSQGVLSEHHNTRRTPTPPPSSSLPSCQLLFRRSALVANRKHRATAFKHSS